MWKKRITEINARKAELRRILENDQNADLDAIEKELRDLDTELQGIERRARIAGGISNGSITGNQIENPVVGQRGGQEPVFTRENVLSTPEYRTAWAKTLMHRSLTDVEQRALDTAMTTTATEYVEPTASVDGVNNGGLFIPTDINTALMEAISLVSPLFRDAARTAIPGLLKFPYKKKVSGAKNKKETEESPDGSYQWAELNLGLSEIAETIRVSWRLEAMAIDQFISYITEELIEQVQDKLVTEFIYGTGTNQMKGVTVDAIKSEYEGTALDGIGTAIGKLGKKQKIGAKIYVAQSIVEEISFTKDTTGNYIYTPINGAGIKSIATYKVEVDPYLNDGEFVIGNMRRYYRLNVIEPISMAKDSSGKKRANDYTAYTIVGGAAQPDTMVYGKKKVTSGQQGG